MKKVFAIFFAMIILVGNINLTIGMHLCGGHLFDSEVMIGEAHMGCGMGSMDEHSEDNLTNELSFKKARCCDNEYIAIDTEDDFSSSISKLELEPIQLAFIATFLYSTITEVQVSSFPLDYGPPLIFPIDQPQLQVFLI